MSIITSAVSVTSEAYRRNREAYEDRLQELYALRREARRGGREKSHQRNLEKGKMLPRHRVEALLDPGSPFLEIGDLAGKDLYQGIPPGAGIITGIGMVSGRACMIIANDWTVKGGTYFGATCRKHVRAQKIAWQSRLPGITLVDSGGAFLPDQANIFPDIGQFGTIFHQQIGMSADKIPQIAVVMGSSTAGGAYMPALSDEVVIVRGLGFMYLGGPELTFAATGEKVDMETLGGGKMHSSISGVTDHLAESDLDALAITREIVRNLGEKPQSRRRPEPSRPPRHDPAEIHGIVSCDIKVPTNMRDILARLLDDSEIQEFKPLFGDTLITGFARIHGFAVGVLASNGVLFSDSALKGTHFIDLCCKRDVPLLFLSDVTGFMVGRAAEQGGIAKDGAKYINAISSARVPKFTINVGDSYGAGYFGTCGRPLEPNAIFAWPNARAGIMGPEQAASVLSQVKRQIIEREGGKWSAEEEEDFKKPVRKLYSDFQTAYNFAANLWIDGIITPVETREVLALLLDVSSRVPAVETRFAVNRF